MTFTPTLHTDCTVVRRCENRQGSKFSLKSYFNSSHSYFCLFSGPLNVFEEKASESLLCFPHLDDSLALTPINCPQTRHSLEVYFMDFSVSMYGYTVCGTCCFDLTVHDSGGIRSTWKLCHKFKGQELLAAPPDLTTTTTTTTTPTNHTHKHFLLANITALE